MKRRIAVVGVIAAVTVAAAPTSLAAQPPAKSFVAVLSAGEEVPLCALATNAARGVAVLHVRDEASGTVEFKIVANNLPGDVVAAHIHRAPKGAPGPVVQALPPTPGAENGVIAHSTFSNPALLAEIRANPDGFYINVHTGPDTGCPPGVIRGQLGDRGPLNQ